MTVDTGDAASQARQRFSNAEGVIAPTTPEGRSGFLSDVLVELGLAPREAVEEAVEFSRTEGATPCADRTQISPGGMSSSESTKTAPRASSLRTTLSLWTIS